MNKKLSIIICAYNAEKYIEDCINSIINQINNYCELIIINDGSNDKTERYLEKLTLNISHNNIRIVNKENSGLSDSRNLGMSISNADYITFLDADDVVVDDFINIILDKINGNPDIIEYNLFRFDDNGFLSEIDATRYNPSKKKYQALKKTFISCNWFACSRVYKKVLFSNVKFPVNKRFEDMAIVPVLYLKAKKIITIDAALYGYRVNENGICSNNKLTDLSDVHNHMENWFKYQETIDDTKLLVLACFRTSIFIKNINQNVSGRNISISNDARDFIKNKINFFNFISVIKFIPYLYFTKISILISDIKNKI